MTAGSQATFATVDSGDWLATASKGRYVPATYRTTGVSLPMPTPSALGGELNTFSPGPTSAGGVDNYHETSHFRGVSTASGVTEGAPAEEIVKIKAIRTAPHKITPPPTSFGFWRNSIEIERGVTPSSLSSSEGDAEEEDGRDEVNSDGIFGNVDSPTLGHTI